MSIYPRIIYPLECLILDSGTGNNNTEDVNGVNHKLRIKLYNEKQKQTDGFISTSPTGEENIYLEKRKKLKIQCVFKTTLLKLIIL